MIFLIGFCLVAAVIVIHYEVLRGLSVFINVKKRTHRYDMLMIMFTVVVAHLTEVFVFALTYWVRIEKLGLDKFATAKPSRLFDYFYFSLETYTTLGYGDLYLQGNARLLSSLEGLIGVLAIGWSASFILLILKERWEKYAKDKTQ